MVISSEAMLYRPINKITPMKARPFLQNNLKRRSQVFQKPVSMQSKLLPKKPIFNVNNFSESTKKSWSPLLAAFGLGWLWYSQEDKEKKDEEKSEEKIPEKYTLNHFITKFAPPKEIQETLEAHKDALASRRKKPYLIEGTQPPMYHKWDDIDRVINAELLKEVIKQNNLDIEIPNKYIYPNPNNGKYEVFAQGIPLRPLGNEQLTLKEIQALAKLTVESGYTDFKKDNLFRNPHNNKLIIIDTENASFLTYDQLTDTGYQIVNRPKKIGIRFIRDRLNSNFKINKDAQVWIVSYTKKLEDSKEGEEVADLYTSRYNKLNISAENARELKREIQNQHQGRESFTAKALWRMKHAIQSMKG